MVKFINFSYNNISFVNFYQILRLFIGNTVTRIAHYRMVQQDIYGESTELSTSRLFKNCNAACDAQLHN